MTRAAAEVSASKEDLLIAQTNVAQQEIVLKNALSRNGMENTWLDDVHIIPLDHIEVPKTEEVRPMQDLIEEALANRPEIEQSKINLESQKILLKGDKNGLLPTLSGLCRVHQQRFGGPVNPLYNGCCGSPTRTSWAAPGTVSRADLPPQFSELLGGLLAEHSVPQPRGAGRLRDRPAAAAADASLQLQRADQPGARGREDRRDRPAAGARAV